MMFKLVFQSLCLESKAMIDGDYDVHVHEGSEVELICRVKDATTKPPFIFWFHNESMVNFQVTRPLHVDRGAFWSSLSISKATLSDAGQYRCEPSDAIPANLTLHVIVGKCYHRSSKILNINMYLKSFL